MSWVATAWAKSTHGHASYGIKLILFVLADYHDPGRGYAWPKQTDLMRDADMPERTVRWCLDHLATAGFITRLSKGNQYQPTKYKLNFNVVEAQNSAPARLAGALNLAEAHIGEAAMNESTKAEVNRQDGASEPAMLLRARVPSPLPNLHEPPEEKSIETSEWVEVLEREPRWKVHEHYVENVEKVYGSLDLHALAVEAYEWLQGSSANARKKKDLGRFFLNWLKRAKSGGFSDNGPEPQMARQEHLRAEQARYERGE